MAENHVLSAIRMIAQHRTEARICVSIHSEGFAIQLARGGRAASNALSRDFRPRQTRAATSSWWPASATQPLHRFPENDRRAFAREHFAPGAIRSDDWSEDLPGSTVSALDWR